MDRRRPAVVLAVLLVAASVAGTAHAQTGPLPTPLFDGYAPPGATQRVSLAADGGQIGVGSTTPSLSGDARLLTFVTSAPLVADDTNDVEDVYVRDLATGGIQRVSVAADGSEGEVRSGASRLSRDGRHVAFVTAAALVPEDTNDAVDVYVRDFAAGTIERVSVSSTGEQASAAFSPPALTPDGRYVVFQSNAANLVPGDTNDAWDVFVRDRVAKTTERVTVATDGSEADTGFVSAAWTPSISDDGRHVAFGSYASNLVEGDTNGLQDIFVRDRVAQTTEHMSVSSQGERGKHQSAKPVISGDGRYVAFWSISSNLVPEDTTGAYDIFVRDRVEGTTERVSIAGDGGTEGDSHAFEPVMTPDGRFVAYMTLARTLVEGDEGDLNVWDVHIHDREAGSTERVSIASDGTAQTVEGLSVRQPWLFRPTISDDGRYVAFGSDDDALVEGDSNEAADLFLRDRGPLVGVGGLSASDPGGPVIGWARFSGALLTASTDAGDDGDPTWRDLGGELTGASLFYRPERRDLFVRLDLSHIPAVHGRSSNLFIGRNGTGRVVSNYTLAPGVLYGLAFEVDGTTYEVRATRVAASAVPPHDPNLVTLGGYINPRTSPDSYFALFRCAQACEEVARLAGGLGRRGEQLTAALPLSLLGVAQGSTLGDVTAYTAVGDATSGPLRDLDDVDLGAATIPAVSAAVGSAPAGTSPAAVTYDEVELRDGRFSAALAGADPENEVWARACIGEACGYERLR